MLRVHIRDDHRILGMNKYVQGIQKLGNYNCEFCDQTFEEEFGLMNHIQNFHQGLNDMKILRPNVASGSRSAGMKGVQTENNLVQQTYENQNQMLEHFEQFELESNNRLMAEENNENELITSLNYFKRHAGTF